VIEKALIKIGHLLALGFGEAGSQIIGTNIGDSGDINPLLAGEKVQAIFGFCDIRNFTDSTEILQTQVMLFVNQIAEITHSVVDKYGGSANKNIGDAFFLVWKFKDQSEFF
jgi:class 3 adenylate cyclase